MAVFAVRDFECILCQRQFSLPSGDLIVPESLICDECLAELWQLEGDALARYVSEHLAKNASQREQGPESHVQQGALENRIIRNIQSMKLHWASAEEVIRNRGLFRGALG